MRAKVKTRRSWKTDEETAHIIGSEAGYGMWIECVITDPPSSEGRNVDMYVPEEVIVSLMKDFKDHAIRSRSKTMTQ